MESNFATPSVEHLLAHSEFLQRIARAQVGDEPRAADIVQEAYLRALETVRTQLKRGPVRLEERLDENHGAGRCARTWLLVWRPRHPEAVAALAEALAAG